jgi:hypothetical protein
MNIALANFISAPTYLADCTACRRVRRGTTDNGAVLETHVIVNDIDTEGQRESENAMTTARLV